jgi:hypothetical protein
MEWDVVLMMFYRAMALTIALAMVWTMLTDRDWRFQAFAALVFVPFALRAVGVK